MTNNKQQTEINAVEYLDKVNQFAKENNTGKPKQQTAIEWLVENLETQDGTYRGFSNIRTTHEKLITKAKEMEKEQMIESYRSGRIDQQNNAESNYNRMSEEHYNETFGGGEQ